MSGRFKPPGQCPICGEWAPRGAVACDECGACEASGWSGKTHDDGLDLPNDEFDYDDFIAREFPRQSTRSTGIPKYWWWVALLLLVLLVAGALAPIIST